MKKKEITPFNVIWYNINSNKFEADDIMPYRISRYKSKKKKPEDVELMTIHKSKGLESENVYLVGVEQGKFPSNRASLSEESKLFYVAVTRPKTNLYISEIGTDDLFTNQYFNK